MSNSDMPGEPGRIQMAFVRHGLGELSPDVQNRVVDYIGKGMKIRAIRDVRLAAGLGLKEAKDAVESISLDIDIVSRTSMPGEPGRIQMAFVRRGLGELSPDVQNRVVDYIGKGMKIRAIRDVRLAAGLGLKEAKDAVESIGLDLGIISQTSTRRGCYIATACYGSYDHPDVLVFRRFRDDHLAMSMFGRLFIRIYYHLSPPIALRLEHTHWLSQAIRRWLLEPLAQKIGSSSPSFRMHV